MNKFFNTVENVLFVLILICLVSLALASMFIWHNLFCAVLFSAGVIVWLFGMEAAQNE